MKDDSFKVLLKTIVTSIVGTSGAGVVDLLYGKKNVNEFLIAKKLNMTINQTRNVLYKLADEGLVSFIRKKDSKKGGWYTYFWTLNSDKSLLRFKETLENSLNESNSQLNARKNGRFFFCENCHIESNEETALINNYTCSECGEVLTVKDVSEEVKNFEKEKTRLEGVLEKVNTEISILTEKGEKSKTRRLKAEAKKKLKERATRRALKAKEKKKEEKKVSKKIIKKVKKVAKKKAGKKRV